MLQKRRIYAITESDLLPILKGEKYISNLPISSGEIIDTKFDYHTNKWHVEYEHIDTVDPYPIIDAVVEVVGKVHKK